MYQPVQRKFSFLDDGRPVSLTVPYAVLISGHVQMLDWRELSFQTSDLMGS